MSVIDNRVTMELATDYLVIQLIERYGIGKITARKLLANILLRNVVEEEIYSMGDYIMGRDDEED